MDKKVLTSKLMGASSAEEVQSVMHEAGQDVREEQARQIYEKLHEAGKSEELNDDEMENAAGGFDWTKIIQEMDERERF